MEQARGQDPSIVRISDGVWAQVEDRSSDLPAHLDSGAHAGRIRACSCRPLLDAMTDVRSYPLVIAGTRLDCRDDHDYRRRFTGRYAGLDLVLMQCIYCEVVQVRDRSIDLLIDEAGGRRLYITPLSTAKRRDAVLGFYAGRRVSGRTYR